MNKVLELKNVNKVIGKKEIVKDLSFTIEEGEIFGFLGPNGAGKTTTIKMITGLISITSGEIFINGISIKNNFEEALSNVGGIIENPEMYGYLSGLDNLKLYGRMQGSLDKNRISEVVSLVKLENRINDKVKGYSLGMRQRLGLAQALIHKPKLIILDEPTNGLDPVGIKELRETLKSLTATGTSVLVSSHLLSEMELMCDRFCIIDSGILKDIKTMNGIKASKEAAVKSYVLETSNNKLAKNIIEKETNKEVKEITEKITVQSTREEIGKINKLLVLKDIEVYEISIYSKSLEDEFIEITGSKQLR
ncbi:ABC transporter ATP-binding protein [uncultured Clostridium sp.]|uniref:ABC transporter ATP-binding protein n=1 Tax=uncultured Clostridium sp. TaxID=59620 RepID=UPI00261EA87C|nr:ABC transporter ATP-binding protein [uncultured Clostridium sp.]